MVLRGLFRGADFRLHGSFGLNLLKNGKRAKLRWFRIAGAAAGGGNQSEAGNGQCRDEACHGCWGMRMWERIRGCVGFKRNLRGLLGALAIYQRTTALRLVKLDNAGLAARQKKCLGGRRLVIGRALATLARPEA